jgi:hypothetical protein
MGTLHEDFLHLWQYLAEFLLEWEMFQVEVVKKTKTHILRSVTVCRKSRLLWENVKEYGTARQAAPDDIMLRRKDALCMPGN